MQQRRTLSLKVAQNDSAAPVSEEDGGAARLVSVAIARKLCLAITYNRTTMVMAPHILYTRHGDLFVDGVVVEREGRAPREEKLGSFKMAGMSNVTLTAIPFDPRELFDREEERYVGTTRQVVEA